MTDILENIRAFFETKDENGISNMENVRVRQRILKRVATTDQSKSVETAQKTSDSNELPGVVFENGRLVGFGIHIFNEDVYPLKSFEITLRNCGLVGELDLTGCEDMVYLDLYHNRIGKIRTGHLPSMRIFGAQDNLLS